MPCAPAAPLRTGLMCRTGVLRMRLDSTRGEPRVGPGSERPLMIGASFLWLSVTVLSIVGAWITSGRTVAHSLPPQRLRAELPQPRVPISSAEALSTLALARGLQYRSRQTSKLDDHETRVRSARVLHALRLRKTTASLSTSSAGLDWTCWLDSTRLVDWFGVAPPSRKGSKER